MKVDDLVMDQGQRRLYVFERKLSPESEIRGEQLSGLRRVIIHNAYLTEEVSDLLQDAGVEAVPYRPLKSTEVHFYVPAQGHLHIVNSRGIIRLQRDLDQVEMLEHILGRNIAVQVNHYGNQRAKASKRFRDFAYDLVDRAFDKLKEEKQHIQQQGSIAVMLGPHEAWEGALQDMEIVAEEENDFLNYKILKIGDKVAIAFDYIFADQARNVLGEFYTMVDSHFEGLDVEVFHYGKIGLLNSALAIGQVCVPISALDEKRIHGGDRRLSPIHNQLYLDEQTAKRFAELVEQKPFTGTTVNTISVLGQTRKGLELNLQAGGDFLDMEWLVMASLDHGVHSGYPRIRNIRYYFAGVGSDKPLEGKTLGDTPEPKEQESRIAKAFVELIRRGK
ncbi:hypothetical protein HYS48_04980 [Candidatus Woesearchaeota archaeon]|nr:hypothetical protein [Candidatus Woesearchaeota archaeon]